MISAEPLISVGIIDHAQEVQGRFNGFFELQNSIRLNGSFRVKNENCRLVLYDDENIEVSRGIEFIFRSTDNLTFIINDVIIGKKFHWEKKENQTFEGNLRFLSVDNSAVTVVNEIGMEKYLKSVISSEMNADAPVEFLKAHAVTSRSWLAAMLERQEHVKKVGSESRRNKETEDEIIRWYDREDHMHFDVCADDHCQRYQGITKILSRSAEEAVDATRGMFLVHNEQICDARFSKACGGRTELFENCWEDTSVPYLHSISDSEKNHTPIMNEMDAEKWIIGSPDVFCNTSDETILGQILPSFDRKTSDFFRWKVEYSNEELAEIIYSKSGIDFGILKEVIPVSRGPSGRVHKLKIVGTKHEVTVGKELEIRRWLSKSHLYSSAFIVRAENNAKGNPQRFIVHGAGWGHGVGLCQMGAAVMAVRGYTMERILKHYFTGVEIAKLYE